MQYTIVLEQTENNWAAYAPDVPGCIATAPTREAVIAEFASALAFHFEGMAEAGEPIPAPGEWTATVDVDLPATVRMG